MGAIVRKRAARRNREPDHSPLFNGDLNFE
jgi:hypothetical protein